MTNDEWEAEKSAAREEIEQAIVSLAPGLQQAAVSIVQSLQSNPAMRKIAAKKAVLDEWAEEARREKLRQEAEAAVRAELEQTKELEQAKVEARARLIGEDAAPDPRPLANLTDRQRAIVDVLGEMQARSEGTGKGSREILTKLHLRGIGGLSSDSLRDIMIAMPGIVGYSGNNRGRRYWLHPDIPPISPR